MCRCVDMMRVIGIDPGLSGAIAQWDGSELVVFEIPTFKSTGRGREIDWSTLNKGWDDNFFWADHAFLERVGTRPGEGRSSAFKFGLIFGGLRGIIAAKLIPVTLVSPTVWKKHYGLQASKTAAVIRASQLFPVHADIFRGPRGGIKDGVAEAALIARYGYERITGE
jgi:crossover junction endodeoxyribonuclease RuvC